MGVFSEGGGNPLALGELQELEVGGRRYGFWVPLIVMRITLVADK